MPNKIRVLALGAVWRGDELLVQRAEDPETGEPFYRFLGGGVKFGEHSRDAVVREFDEELGVSFVDVEYVGTFEGVFTYAGETDHEIWRVYEGAIQEDWPFETDQISFEEPERSESGYAEWVPVDALRSDEYTFYSPEVLDALEE
jgi:ADP-ribose pyrophosphatase YjhB (NUDIX family)